MKYDFSSTVATGYGSQYLAVQRGQSIQLHSNQEGNEDAAWIRVERAAD